MKINYGEVVAAAQDYMDMMFYFKKQYPGPQYITHANQDLYESYHRMERAERVLCVVCDIVGISQATAIITARAINRAYGIAYNQNRDPGCIDEKVVLEGIERNA